MMVKGMVMRSGQRTDEGEVVTKGAIEWWEARGGPEYSVVESADGELELWFKGDLPVDMGEMKVWRLYPVGKAE